MASNSINWLTYSHDTNNLNNIFTLGECPLNSILTMTVFAVSGVALGYGLKVKDKQRKSMALGNVIDGLCGVTEPIIYTIALPKIKEFVCAFIGGGVAGGIIGFAGIKYYNMVGMECLHCQE